VVFFKKGSHTSRFSPFPCETTPTVKRSVDNSFSV
jgi:hypothetical protein